MTIIVKNGFSAFESVKQANGLIVKAAVQTITQRSAILVMTATMALLLNFSTAFFVSPPAFASSQSPLNPPGCEQPDGDIDGDECLGLNTSKANGPADCESSCTPSMTADPINIGTGNKYEQETDYTSSGPSPLILSRSYNSADNGLSSLGAGWRASYSRSITVSSATMVLATRDNGKVLTFTLTGSVWTGDSDVNSRLAQLPGGWQYTTGLDEIEIYNTNGQLIRVTNRAGLSQTLSYDGQGRLVSVANPFGSHLYYAYNGASTLIASVTVPNGGVYSYAYDANNNLSTVTYPDQTQRSYAYENATYPSALTGVIDEKGVRHSTDVYDSAGRDISNQLAGGVNKYTLDYTNLVTTGNVLVTDALGVIRTSSFSGINSVPVETGMTQSCPSCPAGYATTSKRTSYDANGNTSSQTDFNGNTTTYTYDTTRNLETSRTEGSGTAQARTITTTWHPTYRLPAQIVEPNRTTGFSYDTKGNLLQKTVTDTTTQQSRTWTYTYNSNSQPLSVDGPRTDVHDITHFTYNAQGNLSTVTDALGHVTSITSYNADGQPLAIKDPNNLLTIFQYDPRGRLTLSMTGAQATSYSYDAAGLLSKLTLPDSSYFLYSYDAAHRLTGISDSLGNSIVYTLDLMGNITQRTIKNPDGSIAKSQTAKLDALSRLQQTLGAQNQTTQFGYDPNGNLKSVIDPKNHPASSNTYDALNRLTQVQDAAAGITQYSYNALDQLTQVTAPNGAVTGYTIDALGNLLKETSPDRGTLQATYDAAGNRITRTDARGITASYTDDALNRLLGVSYPAAGENIAYTYDTAAGCSNGIGRLCRVQDGDGATSFAYDVQGNLIQQVRTEAGLNYTTSYGYDSANRINRITSPGNRTVNYSRDAIGNIDGIATTINGVATTLASNIQTNALGLITQQSFANGYNESHSYNGDGQAVSASQVLAVASGGSVGTQQVPLPGWALTVLALGLAAIGARFGRHHGKHLAMFLIMGAGLLLSGLLYSAAAYAPITLQYDANGNLDQRTDGSGTTTYNYDALDRLGNETGPVKTQTLAYDGNGNRTADGAGSYTYVVNSNQLQAAPGLSITTDAAGNITGNGVYTYVYNQAGQLAQVLKGTTPVASYAYDYQGRRTRKQAGATTTLYHYDQAGHLIAESDTYGNILRTYVWRNDTPYAQIESSTGQDQIYYLEVDTLNTPRTARDQTGTIVWQWYSDAFGSTLPNEDPDGNGILTHINLRFPGQYYDQETGLHYNGTRHYHPALGRYLQSDRIGLAGGLNTYTYVRNNPLRHVDPLGLDTTVIITSDYGIGSHAAVYTSQGDDGGPSLYDPAGAAYLPGQRGIGDLFGGDEANLQAYVQAQSASGSTVYTYTFPTTQEQEQAITKRAEAQGGADVPFCTNATSSVLNGIGPFSNLGIYFFPSSLGNALGKLPNVSIGKK